MNHRKTSHADTKQCKKFMNNQCLMRESCWWSHETKYQDFQKVPQKAAPPESILIKDPPQQNKMTNQNIMNMMIKLEENLNIMKKHPKFKHDNVEIKNITIEVPIYQKGNVLV